MTEIAVLLRAQHIETAAATAEWSIAFTTAQSNEGTSNVCTVTYDPNGTTRAGTVFIDVLSDEPAFQAAFPGETRATHLNGDLTQGFTELFEALGTVEVSAFPNGGCRLGFPVGVNSAQITRVSVEKAGDQGTRRAFMYLANPSVGVIVAGEADWIIDDTFVDPDPGVNAAIELSNEFALIGAAAGTEIGRFTFKDDQGNVLTPGADALVFATGGDAGGRFAIFDHGSGNDRYALRHTATPLTFEGVAPLAKLYETISVIGTVAAVPVQVSIQIKPRYNAPTRDNVGDQTANVILCDDGAEFRTACQLTTNNRTIEFAPAVNGIVEIPGGQIKVKGENVTIRGRAEICIKNPAGVFQVADAKRVLIDNLCIGPGEPATIREQDTAMVWPGGLGGGQFGNIEWVTWDHQMLFGSNDEIWRTRGVAGQKAPRFIRITRSIIAYPFFDASHPEGAGHNYGAAISDFAAWVIIDHCILWGNRTRNPQMDAAVGIMNANNIVGLWKANQSACRIVGGRGTLEENFEPGMTSNIGNLFVPIDATARADCYRLFKVQKSATWHYFEDNHGCDPATDDFSDDEITVGNGIVHVDCSDADCTRATPGFEVAGFTPDPTSTEAERRALFFDILADCGDGSALAQDVLAQVAAGEADIDVTPETFATFYGADWLSGTRGGVVGDRPPAWVSSGTIQVLSGRKISHTLEASGNNISFGPFEGDDVNQLEVVGDQLEFENQDVRHFSDPQDADADNIYEGEISAQDTLTGATTPLAHTIEIIENVDEPAQVTGVVVTPGTTTASFAHDAVSGATSYEYSLDNGQWLPLDDATGLIPGQGYSVRLRALKTVGSDVNYGLPSAVETWTQNFEAPEDELVGGPTEDEVDRSTYTFAAHAVGDSDTRKALIVHVYSQLAGTNHVHHSLTIGGTVYDSATYRRAQNMGAITQSLWSVPYTGGPTADIVVAIRDSTATSAATANRCSIIVRAIYDRSIVPTATAVDTASPITQDIAVAEAGYLVASAMMTDGSVDETASWSGLTKDAEDPAGGSSMQYSTAWFVSHTAGGETKTVAPVWDGTPSTPRLIAAAFAAPAPAAQGITAVWADDIVDSVGINCHLNWDTNGSPEQWVSRDLWLPKFEELGIRYVRSNLAGNHNQTRLYMDYMNTNFGTKFCLHCTPYNKNTGAYNHSNMRTWVDAARAYADEIVMLEGPNEVNAGNGGVGAGSWDTNTLAFQQEYYERIRGYSEFDSIPVGGPSVYGRSDDATTTLNGLGIDDYMDVNIGHNYTGGHPPHLGSVPIVGSEQGGSGIITAEKFMEQARRMKPGAPLQVTEEGFKALSADKPASTQDMSQQAQAIYDQLILLEHFLRRGEGTGAGINQECQRTYLYTTHDNLAGITDNYGLWEPIMTNGVMTSMNTRIAHDAIKNLLSLLDDGGGPGGQSRPTLGSLNLSFSGNLTDVQYILTQKRPGGATGKFLLIVWLRGYVWNRASPFGDVDPLPTRTIGINFGATPSQLRVVKPFVGTTYSGLTAAQSISRTIDVHPTILEFTP